MPNCITRGSRTLVTEPNTEQPVVQVPPALTGWVDVLKTPVLRPLKFVQLKTLKASARSCSRNLSLNRRFFASVKSTLLVEGPLTIPRPPLPTVLVNAVALVSGVAWKQLILKNCSAVLGPPSFGLHKTFGRATVVGGGINPKPAGSKPETVGVNGKPVL